MAFRRVHISYIRDRSNQDEELLKVKAPETPEQKELSRRKSEAKLIRYHENVALVSKKPCWCFIDVEWMDNWKEYVNSMEFKAKRPPSLRLSGLLDSRGNVKMCLKAKTDYVAVPPMVFALYRELYGAESNTMICRKKADIYSEELDPKDLALSMKDIELNARKFSTEILTGISHIKSE